MGSNTILGCIRNCGQQVEGRWSCSLEGHKEQFPVKVTEEASHKINQSGNLRKSQKGGICDRKKMIPGGGGVFSAVFYSISWLMNPDKNSHCGKLWEREALLIHRSPWVMGMAPGTTNGDWSTPRLIPGIFYQRTAHLTSTDVRNSSFRVGAWAFPPKPEPVHGTLSHGQPPPLMDHNWGNHFDHRY